MEDIRDPVKTKMEVDKHEFYLLSLGDVTVPMPDFDLFNSSVPLTAAWAVCQRNVVIF